MINDYLVKQEIDPVPTVDQLPDQVYLTVTLAMLEIS
tara:strand:+ start:47 stop:157 length:111 start_codon:yes stop_codon:yes gene_type:complete